jgi:hypothetical protein
MSEPALFNDFWNPLISDLDHAKSFPTVRPLLAHYTSIDSLEGIVRNSELWFSHPLAMNDSEELRFGMQLGTVAFREAQVLRHACGTDQRYGLLLHAFDIAFGHFWNQHAFDTYVFCTALHEKDDNEGRLSMWRGYGGNGSGAAIVLDTAKLNANQASPFIFDRVVYATRTERQLWVKSRIDILAGKIHDLHPSDDQLHLPAIAFSRAAEIICAIYKGPGIS